MKNFKKVVFSSLMLINISMVKMITFATNNSSDVDAPTLTEVRSIVSDGLDLFFGSLGAFAVIAGGTEFYKAFISYRDYVSKGGYGESKSEFVHHIIAGILCLIGAVIIFVVHGWTKDLFSI